MQRLYQIMMLATVTAVVWAGTSGVAAQELGESGFVTNGDVKIHYVTKGDGPLVVMLHGFPDYWYTWRKQIPALAENYKLSRLTCAATTRATSPEGSRELFDAGIGQRRQGGRGTLWQK